MQKPVRIIVILFGAVNCFDVTVPVLLLLLAILYNRYRANRKTNSLLKQLQEIINKKNDSLIQIVQEKEWLLQEVHHRVKNNLQLVMSLLSSQSRFLKDEVALSTLMDSQHRIHSISLIHQKLYNSVNSSCIYVPEYVGELIDFLRDSYKTGLKILFTLDILPFYLDALRALPLGLILNETVTNAIKYAFPFSENDKITIRISKSETGRVFFQVSDNGRGLQPDFDLESTSSFGMILIQGLVKDLRGDLHLESHDGTTITIYFNT